MPMYWLHIEIPAKATLEDLDHFLRAVWLECCGHLSSFDIADETFISDAMYVARRQRGFVAFAATSPPVECAMNAEKRMNAERICFCRWSIHLVWVCATIPEAITIRIASSAPRL